MKMKMLKYIVVLFSACTFVCGCAHKHAYYAVVEIPSMKTLCEVTSERNTRGPSLLNKDDKAQVFYTSEITRDQMHNFIRCYDYGSGPGCKWEVDIPLIVGNRAIWCVGEEVYIGGNDNVWRGMRQATDLYGCVCLFRLDRPNQDPEVIVRPESRDLCCREIAAFGDHYLAFLFGPNCCGEEFSSYLIFDPVQHRIVEKKFFTDEASRLRILSRCMRQGNGSRDALGKFAKEVTDDGCLFYDDHFRLVSKLQAEAIENLFLRLLESQNEEYMRKSMQGKYFSDNIRKWYHSEFMADGMVMFWNIYGSWFVYDINSNEMVDAGVIKLNVEERLVKCVDLDCFLIHTQRSSLLQFLTWDFREVAYELVFIEKGKQERKSIPGLRWVSKLAKKIYCLDFKG